MLFLLFALCSSESLESGSGHLVIHKTLNCLDCDVFGIGHNVTVKVNATVPKKFKIVGGSSKGDLGEVLSGDTATWSYKIVTDQTQLIVRVDPATLTYKRTEDGEEVTAQSAIPLHRSRVIPEFEYARMFESHYVDKAIMFVFFLVSIPLP